MAGPSAARSIRSSPAPGTWTSFSRPAAAAISRVKASVISASTSPSLPTIPASSPTITSQGMARCERTAGSSVAANVPAKATLSIPGMVRQPGNDVNYAGGIVSP